MEIKSSLNSGVEVAEWKRKDFEARRSMTKKADKSMLNWFALSLKPLITETMSSSRSFARNVRILGFVDKRLKQDKGLSDYCRDISYSVFTKMVKLSGLAVDIAMEKNPKLFDNTSEDDAQLLALCFECLLSYYGEAMTTEAMRRMVENDKKDKESSDAGEPEGGALPSLLLREPEGRVDRGAEA